MEGSNEIRFGPMAYYLFGSGEGFVGEGSIGLGLWYDSNTDLAIGMEVNQPKFSVGFSYDLGAFGKQKELDGGAIELSLGFKFGKKCLSEGPPKDLNEIILDTTRLEVKSPVGDSIFTLVATIQKQEVISVDTINIEFIPRDSDVLLIPNDNDLVIFKRKAFFYYISDDINKATAALLDEMAGIMSKFKGIRIKLAGHTCNIGASEADNEALAIRRAEAVKNYLSKKGIQSERVEIEGFGSSRPILSNKTEYGRIKNRRVEFEVLATGASTD
ncbi:MAG: OmpA family protein [Microscillaceae bacterium]|nr:OmpA family protein [Microscillaceae bacterium]